MENENLTESNQIISDSSDCPKQVIKGITPPLPKIVNTSYELHPITDNIESFKFGSNLLDKSLSENFCSSMKSFQEINGGFVLKQPQLHPMVVPGTNTMGTPNLCGMRGDDPNLKIWLEKQKAALMLSQNNPTENDNFSFNINTKVGENFTNSAISNGFTKEISEMLGDAALNVTNNTNMLKFNEAIKRSENGFVEQQLNAVAKILENHGVKSTISTEPLNDLQINENLLQFLRVSSINPTIFLLPNLLNYYEAQQIICLVSDRFKKSIPKIRVNDSCLSHANLSICDSSIAFISPGETPWIQNIERRLSIVAGISEHYLEYLTVQKYDEGQYLKEHHEGDNRRKTIIVFLAESKGVVDFPYAGFKVKSKLGMALLWSNIDENGMCDFTTVNSILPTLRLSEDEIVHSTYILAAHFNKEKVRLTYEMQEALSQVEETNAKEINDNIAFVNFSEN